MPTNLESELRLKDIIFVLKDFRNAIAHNGVIVDVRFKSGSINTGVAQLPFNIYSKLIKTSAHGKLTALRQFMSNG